MLLLGKMLNVIGDIDISVNLFKEFESSLQKHKKNSINISSVNNKRLIVISGEKSLVDRCSLFFKSKNISNRNLNVSAAFHSKLMLEGQIKFKELIKQYKFNKSFCNILSTVNGQEIKINNLNDNEFDDIIKYNLVEQFTEPIRLLENIKICKENDIQVYELVKKKFINFNDYL